MTPYYDLDVNMPDSLVKPGPELDARIAVACGDPFKAVWVGGDRSRPAAAAERDGGAHFRWRPSTDLRDAFEAAEKSLRVDRSGHMNLNCGFSDREPYFECEMSWAEGDDEQGWNHPEVIGTGPTPALAICDAILKLKE